MQPYIVLLPSKDFINKIFQAREYLLNQKLGGVDNRAKVLPHITLVYFEEEITTKQIKKITHQLDKLQFNQATSVSVDEIVFWDHKLVAMLDIMPLRKVKTELKKLLSPLRIKFNEEYIQTYKETIGSHMKLARRIYPNRKGEIKDIFLNLLPERIEFNRIVLIGSGCEEKDILWQKQFCFE